MRGLYSLALYALTPLMLLRLAWRGRANRGYWARWGERFGFSAAPAFGAAPIWIHAVSVGEVLAAVPLVHALREHYPSVPLVLTTTTPTGSERVRAQLDDDVWHCYLPYDLPGATRRFLDRVRPRIGIVMETELWPNLFAKAQARGIPLVLANARLSSRSFRGYQRLSGLVRETVSRLSAIAAQSEADAKRFAALGAEGDQICVMGSIKFELRIPADLDTMAAALRACWGTQRPVWIAASTHAGEDEKVLAAFDIVRRDIPQALLILVPRHPERFDRVAVLCERAGYRVARRSRPDSLSVGSDLLLGDTMGELMFFYAAADVAFVGGSLVPTGGHNVLEPAALGRPVVCGPHVFNFREIVADLMEAGAMVAVQDADTLAAAVVTLLRDTAKAQAMGEAGRVMVEQQRGALERLLERVAVLLPVEASQ